MFSSNRKRKNDYPPPFPAWILILVALGVVIVIAIFFQSSSRQISPVSANNLSSDLLTPTPCVRLNTPQLNVTAPKGNLDPLELTATAIVGIATSEAQGTKQPCVTPSVGDLDPFELTATYIVQQVTLTAQGTPQPSTFPSSGILDPIELTATFIVDQATAQAGTPAS